MKKSMLLTVVGLSMGILSGCGSITPKATTSSISYQAKAFNNLPGWIPNPTVENGIAAVGVAKYTQAGPSFMIPEAELVGKMKLAAQVQSELSGLAQGNKQKINDKNLDEYSGSFRQVYESFIKKTIISGAKRIKTYQDPYTGDMYVMMAISFDEIANQLEKSKDDLNNAIKQSSLSQKTIQDRMKILDKSIARLRQRADQ